MKNPVDLRGFTLVIPLRHHFRHNTELIVQTISCNFPDRSERSLRFADPFIRISADPDKETFLCIFDRKEGQFLIPSTSS